MGIDVTVGTAGDQAARRFPGVRLHFDHPLRTAGGATALTYEELAGVVRRTSAWLHAAGLRPGEVVAVCQQESFDILVLAMAAARLGALPALLSCKLPEEHATVLRDRLRPALVLTDRDCIDSGAVRGLSGAGTAAAPASVLLVDGAGTGAGRLDEADPGAAPPPHRPDPGDPSVITHTSGTTGVPKLVVHSAGSIAAQGRAQVWVGRALRLREPVAVLISWVHARAVSGVIALASLGLPLVALRDAEPESVGRHLLAHRPVLVETHPNLFLRWEPLCNARPNPFASVRIFFSTFDSIHPRTVRLLLAASERRMPLYVQSYTQSETGPITVKAYTRRIFGRRDRGTDGRDVGRPLPGLTRIRVIDPDTGRRALAGEPGAIQVRSRGVCLGYAGEDEAARGARHARWWATGDLGLRTRWGSLRFLDREVDAIPGFGSTLAVEDRLLDRLDELAGVVVVASDMHPLPVPVIATHHGGPVDPDAWASCTADLPPMAPPVLYRWADLPRTDTFKVRRHDLREALDALPPAAGARG